MSKDKLLLSSIIPTLPRSSAPLRSICLVPGSASVATTPQWTRLVSHRDHRSVNTPTHCQSQSRRHRRGASHRVYPSQPHEPKLVPREAWNSLSPRESGAWCLNSSVKSRNASTSRINKSLTCSSTGQTNLTVSLKSIN